MTVYHETSWNAVMNRVSRTKVTSVCRNEPSEDRVTALECRRKSENRNEENDQIISMGLFNFAIHYFWERRHFADFVVGVVSVGSNYRHQINSPNYIE